MNESGHWYDPKTQQLVLEVPYAVSNKAKAGQMRPATARDAKPLGLVASVTRIISEQRKFGLERWKDHQLIEVVQSGKIKRLAGEPIEAWFDRIREAANEVAAKAADIGTRLHRAIEDWLRDGTVTDDPEILPLLHGFIVWYKKNVGKVIFSERQFATDKFGGTVDLGFYDNDGCMVIADIKGRGSDKDKPKLGAYDNDCMQLAAYRLGLQETERVNKLAWWNAQLWNVLVSRDEPGRVEVVNWTSEGERMGRAFLGYLEGWRQQHKFAEVA